MPGQEHDQKRKRRRVFGGGGTSSGEYEALAHVRSKGICADALGDPTVALALNALLASLRPSTTEVELAHQCLRTVKAAFDIGSVKNQSYSAGDDSVQSLLGRIRAKPPYPGLNKFCEFQSDITPDQIDICLSSPLELAVVGSFLVGTSVRPVVIDVSVRIPDGAVQAKDYLNYRYHDRRLLYIVVLAKHLLDHHSNLFADVAIGKHLLAEDPMKPLLSFSPVEQQSITIRIIPTLRGNTFELEKLADDRRNLRAPGESSLSGAPTDCYNQSVLVDSRIVSHLKTVHAQAARVPAFVDATQLLRAWMKRRRLRFGNGFIASALLTHVITGGLAPSRASKEHLFRAALGAIRFGSMKTLVVDDIRPCFMWDSGLDSRWRSEAAGALSTLDAPCSEVDSWNGAVSFLFATARGYLSRPVPLCTVFDAFLQVRTSSSTENNGQASVPDRKEVLEFLDKTLIQTNRIERAEGLSPVLYGLTLPPPEEGFDVFRKVDIRPEASDVLEFREFWGPKAEVRRFKDGRITDALVWSGGRSVLNEIVQYAYPRHFSRCLRMEVVMAQTEEAAGLTNTDGQAADALIAFNELSSTLRRVRNIPLIITTVHAVSPYLRRCSVEPVRPNPRGKYTMPLEIVGEFEKSSAWPKDELAIASAKAAFYIALKGGLASLGITAEPCISYLDIFLGGFVFRLRVRVEQEYELEGEWRERLIWETKTRVEHHEVMRNIRSPLFGNTVRLMKRWLSAHLLLCQFGDRAEELVELLVARVFCAVDKKRQPRSVFAGFCQCLHLLCEFPWEVAPLVIPLPGEADSDYENGPRTRSEVPNGVMTAKTVVEELYERALEVFHSKSADSKTTSMHIAHTKDPMGKWFSGKEHQPEVGALRRVCVTAATALQYIENALGGDVDDGFRKASDWGVLFRPRVDAFDGVISVKPSWVPRSCKLSSGAMMAQYSVSSLGSSIVGLDPVELLVGHLRKDIGEFAMFLFDMFGGRRVYIVWRPMASQAKAFSLGSVRFMTPVPENLQLLPNKLEMQAHIRRTCGTMAERVEFRS